MSRFIEEIPEELFDAPVRPKREFRPEDYTGEDRPAQTHTRRREAYQPKPSFSNSILSKPAAPAKPVFYRIGTRVSHQAFGVGRVTAMQPMGGDMLLTIEFDRAGVRRVMANTASRFMKTLDDEEEA